MSPLQKTILLQTRKNKNKTDVDHQDLFAHCVLMMSCWCSRFLKSAHVPQLTTKHERGDIIIMTQNRVLYLLHAGHVSGCSSGVDVFEINNEIKNIN